MDGYGLGYLGYGAWQQIIAQWQQVGVFTVILPLLLVFAIVFALLERINLFNNKGIHGIISIVIALFTITNPSISDFFSLLFSNLALAIVLLVAVAILIGIVIKPEEGAGKAILGIFIAVGIAIVLFKPIYAGGPSLITFLWPTAGYRLHSIWYVHAPTIILFIILALMVAFVIISFKKEEGGGKKGKYSVQLVPSR